MLIALTLQLLGCIWYVNAELENHILISQPWTFSPYPFFPIQFLRICLHSVKPFLLPKGWLHHHELVWQSRLLAAPVTIHRPTLLFLFECHGMVPSSKGFCLAFSTLSSVFNSPCRAASILLLLESSGFVQMNCFNTMHLSWVLANSSKGLRTESIRLF